MVKTIPLYVNKTMTETFNGSINPDHVIIVYESMNKKTFKRYSVIKLAWNLEYTSPLKRTEIAKILNSKP